ncbi:lipid A ethanolaminephosphotransferase [Acinetobacter calcoaceticus]|uniref:Lipid A ethanolaminephosphotransferase n=1 Tax=Acinetobacter calcoaceticus TaxID=471 RepID=A0A4R1XQ87_ACICA|nr:lipid A ethanolaminephosphotransferase [Acinetobacter calcoaceticus]
MPKFISKIKIPNVQISLVVFNLLVALWIGLFLNHVFLQKVFELTPYSGFKAYLFIFATACVLIALYNLIFQLINWKWTVKLFSIILIFIGGFAAYFVGSLGVWITPDQIQNTMQTDMREARDLLSIRLVMWTIFCVLLPIAVLCWIKIKPQPLNKSVLQRLMSAVASLLIILGLLFVFYVDYAAIFREHRSLKGMISPQNAIASTYSYYKKKAPKKNLPFLSYGQDAKLVSNVGGQELPKLMVLVVGETARAESFSLNGYAKDTNPELSKQADIINYSNVSSCGTATAVSLPCMFSGMPRKQYDEQLAGQREGMLDIAQRAGYKVTWIDNNSGCKGTCDRVEKYVIPEPIKQKWCEGKYCEDELLVDSLSDYIAKIPAGDSTPRLVVLHQLGSHGPSYFKRTPEAFRKFTPGCNTNAIQGCSNEQLVNVYDNSIFYTDHVLNQVIEVLKKQDQYRTGFWYVSDHGESTGEKGMYLHGAPYAIAPSQQTHIPMILWFSPQWKKSATTQVNCLAQQGTKTLSHDNLFPSLLSLLDVKSSVIDPKNNMLSQCGATI